MLSANNNNNQQQQSAAISSSSSASHSSKVDSPFKKRFGRRSMQEEEQEHDDEYGDASTHAEEKAQINAEEDRSAEKIAQVNEEVAQVFQNDLGDFFQGLPQSNAAHSSSASSSHPLPSSVNPASSLGDAGGWSVLQSDERLSEAVGDDTSTAITGSGGGKRGKQKRKADELEDEKKKTSARFKAGVSHLSPSHNRSSAKKKLGVNGNTCRLNHMFLLL